MKIGTFFLLNSIIAFAFGLGLLFMPATIGEMYGMESSAATIHVAQLFGQAVIGIGLITFLTRKSDLQVMRPIAISLFVADAIGLVVEIKDVLNGVTNEMGWSSVALFALLALGFGYFAFIKKE